jgi:SNF2 family DNA or RNA helicase
MEQQNNPIVSEHLLIPQGINISQGMPMIDRFHEDPDVFIFLISTLAGGTGLNLTGANKVVIFG